MQTAGSSLKTDAYLVTRLFKTTTDHRHPVCTCQGHHCTQSQLHTAWPELPPLAAGSSVPPTGALLPTFLVLNSPPRAHTAKGRTVVPPLEEGAHEVPIGGIYSSPWHAVT